MLTCCNYIIYRYSYTHIIVKKNCNLLNYCQLCVASPNLFDEMYIKEHNYTMLGFFKLDSNKTSNIQRVKLKKSLLKILTFSFCHLDL